MPLRAGQHSGVLEGGSFALRRTLGVLGAPVAVPLAPRPLPAAAGPAGEAAVLADVAGVDGKGASSSSRFLFLGDGPLLCSHLFQEISNV